ncbi:hypothetical protein CesoFtcFv8_021504 [Champsocephalus esox]|uniref:Uncharacterized protein n=1 Tax=Champsocephalus esox TaxID=159716 RepID=A0AAN8BD29_9TELE|nr:hypothetical protein CesoFtcFv8_021504 [Champsocephalus esox]
MEPHFGGLPVLTEQSLQSDPQMAQRIDAMQRIRDPPHAGGGRTGGQDRSEDIDDEEKFLYGDAEDPKTPSLSGPYPRVWTVRRCDGGRSVRRLPAIARTPPTLRRSASPRGLTFTRAMGQVDERAPTGISDSPDQNLTGEPRGQESVSADEYREDPGLLKDHRNAWRVTEISNEGCQDKERLHGNTPSEDADRRQRSSPAARRGGRARRRRGPQQEKRATASSRSGKAAQR